MYIKNPEYFITTVREGSISKAAEKLYLSQPYLSQCIARTEKELGVKLFDRSHMPLKLTEAGKIYMRYLESVGVLTGQFEEQLGELKTGRSRTLNVGMTLWRGSVLLPDILPSYSESHPDVRITLREHHTAQLSKLLQEDQIDFALMNMPLNLDDFVYDTIFNERLLLVASKDHPAIRGLEAGTPDHPLPIDMKKLRRERFILLQEDQVMGHAMKNLFANGTKGCPIHHQQYDFGQPGGKRVRHHLPPGRRNPPHCPRGAACILHRRQSTVQRAAAAFI